MNSQQQDITVLLNNKNINKKNKTLEIYLHSETDTVLAGSGNFRRFKGKASFIYFNYSLLIFSVCMWCVKLLQQYLLT